MAKNLVNFYKGGGKVKPTHSDAPAYIIGQDENGFPIYRNPESAKGASFNRSFPAVDFMKQRPNSYKEVSNPFNYGTNTPTIGGGYGKNFGGKLNPYFQTNTGVYIGKNNPSLATTAGVGLSPDIRLGDSFIPHSYVPRSVFTPSVEVGSRLGTSTIEGNTKLDVNNYYDLKGKFTYNVNPKTALYGYGELNNNQPIVGIGGNFSNSNLKEQYFNFGVGYNAATNSPTVTGRMVMPIGYKTKYNKPIDFKTEPSFKYGGKITKKYKSSIKPYGPPTNPQGMSQGPTMQRGVMFKKGGPVNPLDDPKNKPTIYRTSGDVRSEYDPVSNNIYWNPYNNPQAPLNVLKHEGYHWAQNMFGDLQIPELYPGPLRRPQTPVNPNTSQIGDYYNRSAVEQNYIGNKFVNENPSFQFTPSDLVFNRVVDPSQYDYNVYPNTVESDAQRYEDYAPTNLNKPIMGKYGPTDVNKYANGGTVNWLDQYEAGDIKNPSNQSDFNYPHVRKFKDGGSTNPPIHVSNPNDPRLRAYEDSLALSNFSKLQHKLEPPLSNWLNPFAKNVDERNKGQFILEKTAQDLVNNNSNISWESSRYAGTGAKFIVDSRRNPNIKKGYVMDQYWPEIWKDEIIPEYVDNQSPDIIHKTIKPIGHWWGRGQNNEYIAPVQPYIYSKPDTDLNQGNINISRNNYPGAVASRTDEDYTKQHSPIYVTDRNNPNIGQYNKAGNQYVYTPPPPMKKMKSIEPSFNTTQEQPQTRPYVESFKPNFYMDSRGEWSDKPQTAPIYTEEQLLKMGYRNPQRKKEGGGVYTPMNEQIFPLLKFANGGKTSAITQKSNPSFRPLFLPQSLPTGYTDWNDWYAQNPNPKTLPVVTQEAPKGLDYANLYHRQAAKESGMFTPSIVSGKQKSSRGAMGMTQIMPSAKQEYEKATHKSLNLSDPKQAVQAQEWMMGNLLKRPWVSSPKNQSDSVAAAKALVAYNWGPQRTIDYLNAAKAKGIDIYSNKLEWLKGLPLESRDYVSKILLAKDAGFEQDYNEVKNKFRNLYTTPKKKQGGQVTSWLDTLK